MTGRPDLARLCLSALLLYGCIVAATWFATTEPPWPRDPSWPDGIHAGHVHAVATVPLGLMFLVDFVAEIRLLRRPRRQRVPGSTDPPATPKAPRTLPVHHG